MAEFKCHIYCTTEVPPKNYFTTFIVGEKFLNYSVTFVNLYIWGDTSSSLLGGSQQCSRAHEVLAAETRPPICKVCALSLCLGTFCLILGHIFSGIKYLLFS